jgi:hypothetical protein
VLRTLLSGLLALALGAPAFAAGQAAPAKPAAAQAKPPAAPQGDAPAPASPAQTQDQNLSAYVELLRSDVRSQKVAILTELMNFTEAEDTAFWPIYREYDVELSTLNDERVALIKDYAKSYPNVSDEQADALARKALDINSRRNALQAKYYDRVKSATSAKTAARFLQVEHQLLLIIDLQIAAALPIVQ